MGAAGGAGGQVRVAPRGGRLLRRLPAPHAGPGPREEGHGGRMPTPPLDRHLVAPSRHCTSPLPSPFSSHSPETATDHFPVWAYLINIYYFFFLFVLLPCSYHWGVARVYVLLFPVSIHLSLCIDGVGIPVT